MKSFLTLLAFTFFAFQWGNAQGILDSTFRIQDIVLEDHHESSESVLREVLNFKYLDAEYLTQNLGNTFVNTLEKVPGISSINTGVGISKPVIRGLYSNRVLVNVNGIKQEGQQWGLDHGLEIDRFDATRVELIKGPASVLYGSEGLGGVINILPPAIPEKNSFSGALSGIYQSNNDLFGGNLRLQGNKNDFYIIANASYQNGSSYRVPAKEFIYNGYKLPIYNNRLQNTGMSEANGSLTLGYRGKKAMTSLSFSTFNQKAGFFIGAFGVPKIYDLVDNGNYRSIQLPYQSIQHYKITSNSIIYLKKGYFEIDLGWQYNLRKEVAKPHAHGNAPLPDNNNALDLKLMTNTANVRFHHSISQKWHTTYGFSFQHQFNKIAGYEFLLPQYFAIQSGLYAFAEYKHSNKITLAGGLRGDFAYQNAKAFFEPIYNNQQQIIGEKKRSPNINKMYGNASGSIGLAWNINEHWKWKNNLGTAYRIPSIIELASNGVHHGTFRHEMGDSALKSERGFMYDTEFLYWHKKVEVTFSPFFNYFTNYIYLRPSAEFSPLPDAGQIFKYSQATAFFAGIEAEVTTTILKNYLFNTSSLEYVFNGNLDEMLSLPYTPPFSLATEFTFKPSFTKKHWKDLYASIRGQYFAPQNLVDRNEARTPGYFLLSFSAGNTFHWNKNHLGIFVQIRNMTNARYLNNMSKYRILNIPEQGINASIMIRYSFGS